MSDNIKRFLTFSKSERIAIMAIIAVILIIITIKFILIKIPPKRTAHLHNLDSIIELHQSQIDSILTLDSIREAERKASHEKRRHDNAKWKARDSKGIVKKEKVTRDTTHYKSHSYVKTIPIVDINIADTTALKELPGIGSAFARRIVEYREKLGGYVECSQLMEVYGMDTLRYGSISRYVTTDSLYQPNTLRVNYDSFKVLNRHPYLGYEDVKKIVNHREQKGLITSWTQLSEIIGKEAKPELESYVSYE